MPETATEDVTLKALELRRDATELLTRMLDDYAKSIEYQGKLMVKILETIQVVESLGGDMSAVREMMGRKR